MNKKTILTISAVLAAVQVLYAQDIKPQMDLDLDKSFQIAVKNNAGIKIADERYQMSKFKLALKGQQFLPELQFSLAYLRQDSYIPFLSEIYYLRPEEFNIYISFMTSIYEGGRLRREWKIARTEEKSSQLDIKEQRSALYMDVARAYYRLLKARETRDFLLEIDRDSRMEYFIADAVSEYNLAVTSFNYILGIDLDTKINIMDDLAGEVVPPGDLAISYAEALHNRFDLQKTELNIERQKLEMEIVKAYKLPRLYLYGEYGWWQDFFPPGKERWKTQLVFSFPIFSKNYHKEEMYGKKLFIERIKQEELKRKIFWELKMAYIRLDSSVQKVKTAERYLKNVNKKDLLSWVEKKQTYLSMKYEYLLARLEFERVVGQQY